MNKAISKDAEATIQLREEFPVKIGYEFAEGDDSTYSHRASSRTEASRGGFCLFLLVSRIVLPMLTFMTRAFL